MLKNNSGRQAVALWASAFVLAAIVIMQAGKLPQNEAYGGMASSRGDYVMVTLNSGEGGQDPPWELLYLIDSRDQMLMVYQVEDARQGGISLRDGGSLVNLFRAGRG